MAVLTAGLVLAARCLLRRTPATRRTWTVLFGATAGVTAGLLSALGVGLWLPHAFDLDLRHILRFLPDIGHLAVGIIAIGSALTATAAALLVRTLLGPTESPRERIMTGDG